MSFDDVNDEEDVVDGANNQPIPLPLWAVDYTMNPLYCDRLPFVEFSDEQDVEDHDDDENLKIHNIIHILVWTKYTIVLLH